MHTYITGRDRSGDGTVFHFNSDLSGEVVVDLKKAEFHQDGDKHWVEVKIPAADLIDFIMEMYVKVKAIELIEQADLRQLLEKIK